MCTQVCGVDGVVGVYQCFLGGVAACRVRSLYEA